MMKKMVGNFVKHQSMKLNLYIFFTNFFLCEKFIKNSWRITKTWETYTVTTSVCTRTSTDDSERQEIKKKIVVYITYNTETTLPSFQRVIVKEYLHVHAWLSALHQTCAWKKGGQNCRRERAHERGWRTPLNGDI